MRASSVIASSSVREALALLVFLLNGHIVLANETVGKGAFVEGMVAQGTGSKREEFFINADDKNVAS